MTLHVRLDVAKTRNVDYSLYVYEKKGRTNINSKFSGDGKGGQNNKVWETLKNQNRVIL